MKNLLLYFEHIFVFFNELIQKVTNNKRSTYVLTYLGYSNGTKARVLGRVVEKDSHTNFSTKQERSTHFLKVIKLFMTKKIQYAKLKIPSKGPEFQSNSEGFFSEIIESSINEELNLTLSELDPTTSYQVPMTQVPPNVAKIFISDIDDTIIKSKAVSMKSLVLKTLFLPLSQRQAFDEAARVYNRIAKDLDEKHKNQFFYVSSSTWNLYPLLKGFLRAHNFPSGPLLLQDIATEKKKSTSDSHQHKSDRIKEILDFFPKSKYVLIGDAGQKDAPIYLDIAKQFPNNVELILIRHTWWTEEFIAPKHYLEQAEKIGVPIVYFSNLEELDENTIKILET